MPTQSSFVAMATNPGVAGVSVDRLISKKELLTLVPYTPQHILRLEKERRFPKRVRLGPNRVGWVYSEVIAWMEARVAERDAERIVDDVYGVEPSQPQEPENAGMPITEPVAAAAGGQGGDGEDLDNQFLTITDLAKMLNRSPQDIEWLEISQRIPVRIELADGRLGWFMKDIMAWREARGLDVE